MAVTIYEVARRAGVGIGTVSRAINNSPNIHPDTKARILKIAQELNYLPHALAQSLARKKTQTVGCIVPFFTNYFTAELLKHIQHALTDSNYDLILFSLDRLQRLGKMLDRVLAERRVDGVLLISVSLEERHIDRLINQDLPVVLVDGLSPQIDYVAVNNFSGAVQATRHLIQLGHQRIGLINASLKSRPARLRHDGFRQALAEGGLNFDDSCCVVGESNRRDHGFSEESGYFAMRRLLRRKVATPSALFIASDVQALGAIHAAEEAGLRIPDDIALVGFDDIEFAKFVGLTTMRQPVEQMAHAAVRHIVDRMQGARASEFTLELMPELIVRESCGCQRYFCVDEQIV